ncbi:MAG: YheU family protein [Enterobacterales bacterium]|nr:YheU family protein [Enterobacterales bacterium]
MIIPFEQLAPDTLNSLIREFVLREGTDYGDIEVSLENKVAQVLTQIKSGKLVITYSDLHDSVDIAPANQFSD